MTGLAPGRHAGRSKDGAAVRRQPFRADIQGLRAIAVLLVVLYHAGAPVLSGGFVGVDVFFVISGFLITNHLLSSYSEQGRIPFASFYARRALRILPASVVVLVATLVLCAWLLPPLQWRSTLQDATATTLYVPNVLFALKRTDYLADSTPSLFQHYWSLGVEEQFYLVWPLLLLAALRLTTRSPKRLLVLLAVVVAGSLLLCVWLTSANQPWAFFLLPSRAWELAAGGLVAVVLSGRPGGWNARWATAAWFAGLIGLVSAAILLSDATQFPGWAAALPVASTAVLIAAGDSVPRAVVGVLTNKAALFIGGISYSLYLVHWPVIELFKQAGGLGREPKPIEASLLVLLSIVLAYALFRFVEAPCRNPLWARGSSRRVLVLALAVPGLVAAVALVGAATVRFVPLDAGRPATPQAISTSPTFTDFVPSNLSPTLEGARDDNPAVYELGCHANFRRTEPLGCEFGPTTTDGPDVVLFGDSHAAQWFPALESLAEAGDINLRVETKSACPAADVVVYNDGHVYEECAVWRRQVVEDIADSPPDIVLISSYGRAPGVRAASPSTSTWAVGLGTVVSAVAPSTDTLVLADTPQFPSQPSACLSAHLSDAGACSRRRSEVLDAGLIAAERTAVMRSGGRYEDLNDYVCTDTCGTILGNTLMYRDGDHLTATLSAQFAPVLRDLVVR